MVSEMLEAAQESTLIASLTALATEAASGGASSAAADDDDEAQEEVAAPLNEARRSLVKSLFRVFSSDETSPIELAKLAGDATVEVGPVKENVLQKMSMMDANADGFVTLDEMSDYFTMVGGALSDDEFELILGEMTDNAQTQAMLQMAAGA